MTIRLTRRRLFGCGVVAALLVAASFAPSYVTRPARAETTAGTIKLLPHPGQHRIPTIDGSAHPESISEDRAISVLLLMAAHPNPQAGRSYLRHVFNRGWDGQPKLTPAAIESIRVIAVKYQAAVKALYKSRQTTAQPELAALIDAHRSKVIETLGPDGATRLSAVLTARVKPSIQIFARP